MLQEIFCKPLTWLILILFLFFKGAKPEIKKKKKKKNPERIMYS